MKIPAIVERLKDLSNSSEESKQEIVKASQDFYVIEDYAIIERTLAEFISDYQNLVNEAKGHWGEPTFQGSWNDENFPDWAAPENNPLAFWEISSGAAYIAVQQHDKETPICLVIGFHRF